MDQKPELYPDIDQVNAENYDGQPVTLENLDYLIYKIVARTGLTYDQVAFVVKIYFSEIRTQILAGKKVNIGILGKMFTKLQKIKNNKVTVRLKYKSSNKLIKKARYNAIFK